MRRRVCERLARYCDDYRSKKDVLPLVDDILFPVNSGAAQPESSLTFAEFVEKRYLPGRERNCVRAPSRVIATFSRTT